MPSKRIWRRTPDLRTRIAQLRALPLFRDIYRLECPIPSYFLSEESSSGEFEGTHEILRVSLLRIRSFSLNYTSLDDSEIPNIDLAAVVIGEKAYVCTLSLSQSAKHSIHA